MIQEISFKNFRRFEEFPTMNLGDINIFVGRNNVGKSTVLKALQLMKGNLNTLSNISNSNNVFASMRPMFVFDVDELAELHIDNFERALYNKATRKEITLTATINDCFFKIVLDGQSVEQNSYYVAIPYNYIELKNNNIHLKFNFQTRDVEFTIAFKDTNKLHQLLNSLEEEVRIFKAEKQELNEVEVTLNTPTLVPLSSAQIAELSSRKLQLKKINRRRTSIINELNKQIDELTHEEVKINIENLPEFSDTVRVNIIAQIFKNILRYANDIKGVINVGEDKSDGETTTSKKAESTKERIRSIQDQLITQERRFLSALSSFEMEYIHAHAASQKVIYLKEDKNDTLSRALSQFCKARILPGSKEWSFVKKWMNANHFAIGDDFRIDEIQGVGYILRIIDDGEELNLADKGTGSIQLMTLLLSLAVIMRNTNSRWTSPTVLIEEPEQNIHPMLQSKLADMFLEFWQSFRSNTKCQLIIETHSEYLIRRTQLLVANQDYLDENELLENNPFKVFYFPSQKGNAPYDMVYKIDGRFENSFDNGFYDAAGALALQLSEKEIISRSSENDINWGIFND